MAGRKLKESLKAGVGREAFVQQTLEALSDQEESTGSSLGKLFDEFDQDRDGKLNGTEWASLDHAWLRPLSKPKAALVVVDFQNDFISGTLQVGKGSAGQNPLHCLSPLNRLIKDLGREFKSVIYTYDWHPEDHISFVENVSKRPLAKEFRDREKEPAVFEKVRFERPDLEQVLWPAHCIQGSWGSELHPELFIMPNSETVRKGFHSEADSYSAFFDNNKAFATDLDAKLKAKGVTHVFICGLATDVCVGATARDAVSLGYWTAVIEDCSAGLDQSEIAKVKEGLAESGGIFLNANRVPSVLRGDELPSNWVTFRKTWPQESPSFQD